MRHLRAEPGTYGLGLTLAAPTHCTVGALGTWRFPAGHYIYVGSAWGPGGLRARVSRHLRGTGTTRWHIDYLRAYAQPAALWLAPDAHLECVWAQHLAAHPDAQIIAPRFGASDCRCPSHLFYLENQTFNDLDLPGHPTFAQTPP
ncbi:MAG: GIY-YIG nuclease family protein [Anaerolineae bacterium]